MLHSAILSTFIKLPFVIKIFVLSIFEWQFYIDFTVYVNSKDTGKAAQICSPARDFAGGSLKSRFVVES